MRMLMVMTLLLNGIIVVGEPATADKILLLHHPVVVCVTRAVRFLSARRRLRSKRNERQRKAFNNTMCSFFLIYEATHNNNENNLSLPFDFGGKVLAREKRSSSLLLLLFKEGRARAYDKKFKSGF